MKSARFLAETSLAQLARRLRVLGYDVEVRGGLTVEALYAVARGEGRTVLTPSARHPRQFADVPAVVVPREETARAVRSIDAAYRPMSPAFSRCTECNALLEQRSARDAGGAVPASVARTQDRLMHCPGCERWYWIGSHVDRLCEWLHDALGRRIEPPR